MFHKRRNACLAKVVGTGDRRLLGLTQRGSLLLLSMNLTKLDYCQYLLSSQINYTLTNMAEHLKSWSHDTINRYLKGEKLTPRFLLFEQVEPLLEPDPKACLIFDDTVLEPRASGLRSR